jgi:hypothetical protein
MQTNMFFFLGQRCVCGSCYFLKMYDLKVRGKYLKSIICDDDVHSLYELSHQTSFSDYLSTDVLSRFHLSISWKLLMKIFQGVYSHVRTCNHLDSFQMIHNGLNILLRWNYHRVVHPYNLSSLQRRDILTDLWFCICISDHGSQNMLSNTRDCIRILKSTTHKTTLFEHLFPCDTFCILRCKKLRLLNRLSLPFIFFLLFFPYE